MPPAVTAGNGAPARLPDFSDVLLRNIAVSYDDARSGKTTTASLAEPLLPADGTDTTGVSLWARRGLTAAEEDAPLRGVAELSTEPAEPAPARRGG